MTTNFIDSNTSLATKAAENSNNEIDADHVAPDSAPQDTQSTNPDSPQQEIQCDDIAADPALASEIQAAAENTSNKILFLASNSPRRHEILNQLRVEHTVLSIPVVNTGVLDDEPQLPNEIPLSYVQRTSKEKLDKAIEYIQDQVAGGNPEYVDKDIYILTADTVVTCKNEILGKPFSAEHAAIMLEKLSDQEHTVYTAVNLWHQDNFYKEVSSTQVQFGPLTEEQISAYCQTDEPYDKAGSYAIQGMAAGFVKHLRGSYTSVVGLPAFETMRLLQRSGYLD